MECSLGNVAVDQSEFGCGHDPCGILVAECCAGKRCEPQCLREIVLGCIDVVPAAPGPPPPPDLVLETRGPWLQSALDSLDRGGVKKNGKLTFGVFLTEI